MTAFAEYLLKVMICSGVLTGYYWLALRNKLFHTWNRYYLLGAIILSLLLPFVKISFISDPQPDKLPAYTILQSVTTNEVWFPEQPVAETTQISKEQVSLVLYLLVSLALLLTLFITLLRIKKMITAYEHWKMKDLTFVDTDAKGTPFSFLHYIFWNREIDFESAQGQQIFKHELIHVREKHSLDKLFLQLVLIFCWINPFFWIIRKELTMIHEFIADRKSVKDSDASALAAMILTAAFLGHKLPLTNPFFYSPIKRRLLMLSKLQNPKVGYIGRLMLLPLLTILFTAFALKIKENNADSVIPRLEKSLTVVIDAGHGFINGQRHGAATRNGISEDEISLAITRKIAQLNTDNNLTLIFTRTDENYVDAKERVRIAKERNADLFISIHSSFANTFKTNGKETENPANGFELYVTKDGNENLQASKELGSAIINEMQNVIAIRQPGIKQRNQGIWVIDAAPCPAVLLECGFISNAKDLAFLTNEENQEKIAVAILKGIVKYADNLATTAVNVEVTNPVLDTLPGNTETYVMTADSITFKQLSGTDKLIIVNGKKRTKSWWDLHIISAKKVTVIKENDPAAIKQYGPEAKNGVMIFEDAIISDKNNPGNGQSKIQKVFTKAEVMPKFHDGENGWNRYSSKFLSENLQSLIADGKEGTCEIAFIVDTEGFISDLTVKTMQNTKLAAVFLEALMKGPKWTPATQNGKKVACWQSQKLTFRLPHSNDVQPVAVANAYFPTLYFDIENPLLISGTDVSPEKVNVTSSNGRVTYKNNTWIVKPNSLSEAVITVTDLKESRKTEFVFNVKRMPDPTVTFGNSKGGRVAADKILQSKNLLIEEDWEITNYTMYFTGSGFNEPTVVPANPSPEFNKKILDAIAKSASNTTIVIDEIHARFKKTGLKKTLPPLVFVLY
jgi:N-acetylmuramoyl-L-alanine amidase